MGVVVLADGRREYDTIANALSPLGVIAVWAQPDQPFVATGAQLLIVDLAPDRLDNAMVWRAKFTPELPCLVCCGWEPKRELLVRWIRKPFRLDDFWRAVQAASVPVGV